MRQEELANYISKIVHKFIANGGKLWNIDTNIYNQWKRFSDNLLSLPNQNNLSDLELFIVRSKKSSKSNHWRFNMKVKLNNVFLDKFIEPKDRGDDWSRSAMFNQFIKIGIAFGFWGIISTKEIKLLTQKKVNHIKLELTTTFYSFFLENLENFDKIFPLLWINVMQIGLLRGPTFTQNLALSYLLCYLLNHSPNINLGEFKVKKINNRVKHESDILTYNSPEYQEYIHRIDDETYTTKRCSIDSVINQAEFISFLYDCLTKNSHTSTIYDKNEKYYQYFQLLDEEKRKLRDNIIKDRMEYLEDAIVDKIMTKYNDLDNLQPKKWYIKDCDAAHLFNVKDMKIAIKNMVDNKESNDKIESFIKKVAADPDNGILLLKHWHYYFDENLFTFDPKGRIIILEEDSERLLPLGDFKHARIKSSLLQKGEMSTYLEKRINLLKNHGKHKI